MKKKSKASRKIDQKYNVSSEQSAVGSPSLVKNPLVHIACLVILIFIIYSNTLKNPFQWDENVYIVDNPVIKDLHYFSSPSDAKGFELYNALINRYIGYLTFALNYRIHGFSVTGYHIVNVAIHIANSILVYFLVLLTFRTPFFQSFSRFTIHDSRFTAFIAFFSSAIFAVHPLQTEAVTYVFQRLASLMAMFYLLSLIAYIKARMDIEKRDSLNLTSTLTLALSFFSAILAMKTKENAFTLPLVIVLYDYCFLSRPNSKFHVSNLKFALPFILTFLVIPITLMSLGGTREFDPGSYGSNVFTRKEYLLTQFRVIVTYLRLLFFPVNQNVDYDYPVFKSFFDPQVILSFVFLAALFGLGVYWVTKRQGPGTLPLRLVGFGILWFFITLSVESSIIPIPMLINEYRMYLPSVGIIISVVTAVFLLRANGQIEVKRPLPLFVFMFLVVAILSVATHLRNEVWADGIRLWEDSVEKSPAKGVSHYNLGLAYEAHNMPDKAMQEYLLAIRFRPDLALPHNNLGLIYQARNMPDKAMQEYLLAIKLKPDLAQPHFNLGNCYLAFRRMPDKAMEQYLLAIKLKPDYAEAHYNLGVSYQVVNMSDKAMEQYLFAIKLKPDYADAHINLGILYYRMGQLENARREVKEALMIKPDDIRAQQLLKTIASKK